MSFVKVGVSVAALVAVSASAGYAQSRDSIRIVGSSTVFPYTQAVAEQFAQSTEFPSPVVESTGTGGGMQIFCGGIGEAHPDLTGASRGMTPGEWQLCQDNGVEEITQAQIGSDGLSLAISRDNDFDWAMTLGEMYQALGAQVPVDGEWVDNPYQTWDEINPDFPPSDILVIGPPPTSGTRDAWVELAMHVGCEELDYVADGDFDGDWVEENCSRMRTDGPFVEAGENDNLIVQRLQADTNAMGIFGYSFVFENLDTLEAIPLNGVGPEEETIASGDYPVARPLYFYVKNAHRGVIPGLSEFIEEYMSEESMGPGGYLSQRGMVVLSDERRADVQERVLAGTPMEAPE